MYATLPEHLNRQAPSPRTLDRIYALPRETKSLDDWNRLRHRDLPALDAHVLYHDRRRVESRLDYEADPGVRHWLIARLDAVDEERRRRRSAPPPRPAAVPPNAGLLVRRGGRETAL